MTRNPRRLAVFAASAAAIIVLSGCGLQQDLSQVPNLGSDPKGPATPITAPTLSGTRFDWSSTHGHVVVLNFWGSWCSPCRLEQPALNQLHTEFAPRGVIFLGVDLREANAVDGIAFERNFHVAYPSVNDPGEVITSEYNVIDPPTIVVIDAHGNIVDRFLSTTSGVSADLRRLS
ncbi:MAG TPA: TlpA disulfide reductase family protein [Candidatus Dormibacteraeota bacterium]|jgi:thiol-disulfide isomerase/thioredoxin